MPTLPLVLLAPRVTDDSVRIWKAAIDEGWSVQRLPNWRVPEALRNAERDIVIYAEPLFGEAVADQLNLILLEPPPGWLVSLPREFTGRRVSLSILATARDFSAPTFVKPAEGKVFEARVYSTGGDLPTAEQVDDDLPVLVSDPVTWLLEVRSFVLEREVVALSPYWRSGELAQSEDGSWPFISGEEEEATAFIRLLLESSEVALPPSFVLDVGITAEHGWAVIEGNPCWGAGLYGCAPKAVLHTARRAIRRAVEVTKSDLQWTSPRLRARVAEPAASSSSN